jgi:tetratricopeptide (TPR) repeat protein
MTTSLIDLPKSLQPMTFLKDAEDGLSSRSQAVVSFCREVREQCQWAAVEEASHEAEELWCRHGEQSGHAIAFLWLADLYWTNDKLKNAIRYCDKAVEHAPSGPAPAHRAARAVAHYTRGLSHQMSGEMSAALASYQEALELFGIIRDYWNRMGNADLAKAHDDLVEWLQKLIEYVNSIRLKPATSTDSSMTLIRPWRTIVTEKNTTEKKEKFVLAELALTQTICAQEIRRKVGAWNFVQQRKREWYCCGGSKVVGYKIKGNSRVFGMTDGVKSYCLHTLDPAAQYGRSHLILPAGAPYYALQVADQFAHANKHIDKGDYLLVWNPDTVAPIIIELPQEKPDEDIIIFERDDQGHVHFKEQVRPQGSHILGGYADFDLHPL